MKRKFLWIISSLLAVILSFAFVGCKEPENSSQPSEENKPTLNYTDVVLGVFEKLQLNVSDYDGAVTWKSDDEMVVTVDSSGLLLGVAEGDTQVQAVLEDQTLICNVIVLPSEDVPALFVNEAQGVELLIGDDYTIEPYVLYGGSRYTNATYTYKIYDEKIATVDKNGKITGVSVGTTQIEISADWEMYVDNIRLKTLIPVQIKDNLNAKILGNIETLNLFTYGFKAYNRTFIQESKLSALVEDNGVVVDAEYVKWISSDETVATVDGEGNVKAVGVGTTNITVRYENGEKTCESNPVMVTVAKPHIDITDRMPVLIEKANPEYDFTQLFVEDNLAVTAIVDDEGKSISYTNGMVESTLQAGDHIWTVDNGKYEITTKLFCATKIITTAAELVQMQTIGNLQSEERTYVSGGKEEKMTTYSYSGYFALGNDITLTDADYGEGNKWLTLFSSHMGSKQYTDVGFSGIFEGMGHSIYNAKFGCDGLFGTISQDGTVRNVNVRNATLCDSYGNAMARNVFGHIQNVKISVDQAGRFVGSPIGYLVSGATLENVEITTKNAIRDDGVYATVAYWTFGGCKFINVSVNEIENAQLIRSDGAGVAGVIIVRNPEQEAVENDTVGEDQIWE